MEHMNPNFEFNPVNFSREQGIIQRKVLVWRRKNPQAESSTTLEVQESKLLEARETSLSVPQTWVKRFEDLHTVTVSHQQRQSMKQNVFFVGAAMALSAALGTLIAEVPFFLRVPALMLGIACVCGGWLIKKTPSKDEVVFHEREQHLVEWNNYWKVLSEEQLQKGWSTHMELDHAQDEAVSVLMSMDTESLCPEDFYPSIDEKGNPGPVRYEVKQGMDAKTFFQPNTMDHVLASEHEHR